MSGTGRTINLGKVKGEDAKINGYNTLAIVQGTGVSITQTGSTMTVAADTDSTPTENSAKPITSGGVYAKFDNLNASDVGLGNVGNFKAVSTVANQGLSSTEQENARTNIGAGTSSFDGAYSSLSGLPTLGTAAGLNAPTSGSDAGTTEVVLGDDSRLTDARTPVSHTHGNIKNGGDLQTSDITIGNGDKLVVTDSSDSGKVARASVEFDGSSTNKVLTKAGTWEDMTPASSNVTSVKVGTQAYNPSSGVVELPAYPTTLPASDTTSTYSSTGTAPVNGTAVAAALATLPEPMVYKGTLGTGGTITALPVDGTAGVGYTYKVITAGTYAGQAAKAGDLFICHTKTGSANTWDYIPSADEPSGTVTSIQIKGDGTINVDDETALTTSGVRNISHANSGATAGSYGDAAAQTPTYGGTFKVPYVTVDAKGHVTGISEHNVTIPSSDNTDRYVNSAIFADDSTSTPASPVKMTLTRAGSDSQTVVANFPKVSNTSAGVVPKGAAVSSQSQTTKFLREDGTWAAPSYTTNSDTTYTLATGDANGQIKVTPSSGSAYNVDVKGLGSAAYSTFGTIPVDPSDTTNLNIWIETA